MKFYHGSPKKLKVLKPTRAKGRNKFENQKATFLTKKLDNAKLYAIAKTLKGKAIFAITKKKIIIVGKKHKLKSGYVYEIDINKNKIIKGNLGQYAIKGPIKPIKTYKVNPKEIKNSIIYVNSYKELIKKFKDMIK